MCKRFDVPNPHPDFKAESEESKKKALQEKQALNEKTMESLKQERNRMLAANEILELQNDDELENELDGTNIPVQEKPSMDIFKAIFADSESESEAPHKEIAEVILVSSFHLNVEQKYQSRRYENIRIVSSCF